MAEITQGRRYPLEEAARVLGVTPDDMRQCLSERGHQSALASGELTAAQAEEVLKALKPFLLIGVPTVGRVTAEAEAYMRRLWQEQGAVSTPTAVQFRFSTEEAARAAVAKLPPYPGYTWAYIRVEPGQSAYQVYDAQKASA